MIFHMSPIPGYEALRQRLDLIVAGYRAETSEFGFADWRYWSAVRQVRDCGFTEADAARWLKLSPRHS